jgi:hypothetical protein
MMQMQGRFLSGKKPQQQQSAAESQPENGSFFLSRVQK